VTTLKLNSIGSKLAQNTDKIGMLFGILSDPMYNGRGLSGAPSFIIDRVTHWKIPDPMLLLEQVMVNPPYRKPIDVSLIAYLLGEGMDWFGIKQGKAVKKFAGGLLKGTAISALAFLPAIQSNPHGQDTSKYTGSSHGRGSERIGAGRKDPSRSRYMR